MYSRTNSEVLVALSEPPREGQDRRKTSEGIVLSTENVERWNGGRRREDADRRRRAKTEKRYCEDWKVSGSPRRWRRGHHTALSRSLEGSANGA